MRKITLTNDFRRNRTSFEDAKAARGVSKTSSHTFAKDFILAEGGLVQLQMLMGHSTLDMTRHYVNLYGRISARILKD